MSRNKNIFQAVDSLDINVITNKLSGYCNAFTSYDYTGYLFDFPSENWKHALPLFADCMKNCTMNEEFLNSELKAVIQELKMYKDNYSSTVIEELISSMFPGHPYQHPIIGYKQDLWSLDRNELVNFYKEHYIPNNATLVVTGDVDAQEVFELAEETLGSIPASLDYKKQENNLIEDVASRSVTIRRDVKQPFVTVAFKTFGSKEKQDFLVDVLCWVLATGRSSRLYKKLVEKLHLVTEIDAFSYELFEKNLFMLSFYPNDEKDIHKILDIISGELEFLAKEGITDSEVQRASNQVEMDRLSMLEDSQKQAYAIGQFYLANGDENYIFNYTNHDDIANKVQQIAKEYLRPSLINVGQVLPMTEEDKKHWDKVQQISDKEDERILSRKQRESDVELPRHAGTIVPEKKKKFNFPRSKQVTLPNGLEILFYNNPDLPKIDIALELKAKYHFDPIDKPGLSYFVSKMMLEGTKKYSASELADLIESSGMSLNSSPGYMSLKLLKNDFKKGLELLHEILTGANFTEAAIKKVKRQHRSEIKNYWDNPSQFIGQLACQEIYKGHPYQKNIFGTEEALEKITKQEAIDFYKKMVSPSGARIAVVGDLEGFNVEEVVTQCFANWQPSDHFDIDYPSLQNPEKATIDYKINRDQVSLAFAGPSIARKDPDFDNILLFDQILCGGSASSMSSKLFQLREKSGLFYTISGSLLARSGQQPGMAFIKTIVSLDRLEEAEKQIEHEILSASKNINQEELDDAKAVLISSLVDNFKSNSSIAKSFLFLKRYGFNDDFFDDREGQILAVKKEDVEKAAEKILNSQSLIKFRVGRI